MIAGDQAAAPRIRHPLKPITSWNFTFGSGEVLPELRMHYRTIGTPLRDATDEPSV